MTREAGRTQVVRPFVFVIAVAFILLAPAYRQVLHGAVPVPRWVMFDDTGLWVYKVRFETDAAGGGRQELDRFAVLGYPNPLTAPREVRLITKRSQATEVAGKLCARVGGGRPVYMHLGQAKPYGWKTVDDGEQNLCATLPAAGAR